MFGERLAFRRWNPRTRRPATNKADRRQISSLIRFRRMAADPYEFAESDETREDVSVVPIDSRRQIGSLPLLGRTRQTVHLTDDPGGSVIAGQSCCRIEMLPLLHEA